MFTLQAMDVSWIKHWPPEWISYYKQDQISKARPQVIGNTHDNVLDETANKDVEIFIVILRTDYDTFVPQPGSASVLCY